VQQARVRQTVPRAVFARQVDSALKDAWNLTFVRLESLAQLLAQLMTASALIAPRVITALEATSQHRRTRAKKVITARVDRIRPSNMLWQLVTLHPLAARSRIHACQERISLLHKVHPA